MKAPQEPTNLDLFGLALAGAREQSEYRELCDGLLLDGCPPGLIPLISGKGESTNIAAEYDALNALMQEGWSVGEICAVTGMSKPRLMNLLRVADLPTRIQEAVRAGTIRNGVANRLLKFAKPELKKADSILNKTGALTAQDLDELRQVTRKTAAAKLPASLFSMPSLETAVENDLEQTLFVVSKRILDSYGSETLYNWIDKIVTPGTAEFPDIPTPKEIRTE